jgi:hypothetical protein
MDTISVDLPKDMVEKVAYLMQNLDDDGDYWTMYWACLKAVANEDKDGHQRRSE